MKASSELNKKEAEVLRHMPMTGEYITITEIAKKAFAKKGTSPKTKGNSWVRNSLRKLLRLGLVKHGPSRSGQYALRQSSPLNRQIEKRNDA